MGDSDYTGKTIAVSGGFDPLHVGHLDMIEHARRIVGESGRLMVFVNSDEFLSRKKGKPFMMLKERMRIVGALSGVDDVFAVVDEDDSVCETLRKYKPDIFANGGDRNEQNIPEVAVCNEEGIVMLFNVGGEKRQSSSELLNGYTVR